MSFTGSALKSGDAHKVIQVNKTAEYLIRRYPDHAIVYNIQTVGQVPDHVIEVLRTALENARRLLAKEGGKGSFDIIVRAAETFSITCVRARGRVVSRRRVQVRGRRLLTRGPGCSGSPHRHPAMGAS
jgi:hypothetical protein